MKNTKEIIVKLHKETRIVESSMRERPEKFRLIFSNRSTVGVLLSIAQLVLYTGSTVRYMDRKTKLLVILMTITMVSYSFV